jgi:hypothetical protein
LGRTQLPPTLRQIEELLERIDTLYQLDVQDHLGDAPDALLRRYARRLASRPPSAGRMIREPGRTLEVAYLLRYCLPVNTDRLLCVGASPICGVVPPKTPIRCHPLAAIFFRSGGGWRLSRAPRFIRQPCRPLIGTPG